MPLMNSKLPSVPGTSKNVLAVAKMSGQYLGIRPLGDGRNDNQNHFDVVDRLGDVMRGSVPTSETPVSALPEMSIDFVSKIAATSAWNRSNSNRLTWCPANDMWAATARAPFPPPMTAMRLELIDRAFR